MAPLPVKLLFLVDQLELLPISKFFLLKKDTSDSKKTKKSTSSAAFSSVVSAFLSISYLANVMPMRRIELNVLPSAAGIIARSAVILAAVVIATKVHYTEVTLAYMSTSAAAARSKRICTTLTLQPPVAKPMTTTDEPQLEIKF